MQRNPEIAAAPAVDRSSVSVKIVGNMIELKSPIAIAATAPVMPPVVATTRQRAAADNVATSASRAAGITVRSALQLMDYVSYRAIFEGFQAHLWTENSGRLLWMTHPSWPSNTWQIYSSDYATAAPYYAVKKACEPIHAQLDLPDYRLAVVNTTREAQSGLTLTTRVVALDGRPLLDRRDRVEAAANAVTTLSQLAIAPILEHERLVVVRVTLEDRHGAIISENSYWPGLDRPSQQRLNELVPQSVELSARRARPDDATVIAVTLVNRGSAPVLNAKITAFDAHGNRVLPVYYSDNYVTLLPHETRRLEIHCPAAANRCEKIALRGWDVTARETSVLSMETH